MRFQQRTFALAAMAAGSLLLAACNLGAPRAYPGVPELMPPQALDQQQLAQRRKQKAPAQVVYRIDENRYFELVPSDDAACANGSVYYIDKAQGIRSLVVRWDSGVMGAGTFSIDAANDQYLVGPTTRGNTDCSSGGGGCGGSRMPYSKDGGRTWPRVSASSPTDNIDLRGATIYAHSGGSTLKLHLEKDSPLVLRDWSYVDPQIPLPRKAPLDTTIRCIPNGKE